MSTVGPAVAAPEADRLAAGAVGFTGQLFQSIARMAPAAGIVFTSPFMASQGGGTLPLAFLVGLVCVMFVAYTLRQVVRKVHSAGGYCVVHSVALVSRFANR